MRIILFALLGVIYASSLWASSFNSVEFRADSRSKYYVSVFDVMAMPDQTITVRAKIERNFFGRPDADGVKVKILIENERIGEVVSVGDGYADISFVAPSDAGQYTITAQTKSGERNGYLYVYEENTRFFITDIDNTLTNFDELLIYTTHYTRIPARDGALDGIENITTKFEIIYLTSRDDYLIQETRAWLDYNHFPKAPLFVNDFQLGNLSPEKYKTERIRKLKSQWTGIEAAVGNADYDGAAYTANGLRSYIFHKDLPGSIRIETFQDLVDRELAE